MIIMPEIHKTYEQWLADKEGKGKMSSEEFEVRYALHRAKKGLQSASKHARHAAHVLSPYARKAVEVLGRAGERSGYASPFGFAQGERRIYMKKGMKKRMRV